MAVSADNIKARFPIFEEFEDDVIAAFVTKVERFDCIEAQWTEVETRDEGVMLCTAHYLTLELLQQALIASVTTGVTKGNPPNTIGQLQGKSHWDLTVYGLQFRDLQRSAIPVSGFAFGVYT